MLLKIHPDNPDPKKIRIVTECLENGGTIIYPTDTVYSLGCSVNKSKAIEKIAKIKGIKVSESHFSLVCYDLSSLSEYTQQIANPCFKLMKKAFPGPFTFILPASGKIPKLFKNKKKTVGIRVPDNNIARMIPKELGHAIISTSVYDEDEVLEYTTDPELIYEKYKSRVDIVIDGGYGNNEASTVVDCASGEPEIIRQGMGLLEGYKGVGV